MAIILPTPSTALAKTAQELILEAHKLLGNKDSGEALTAVEKDDGLVALNDMLDGFSTEGLMIYQVIQETYTWPAATTTRTIGSGADFNTNRPEKIEEGTFFRDSSNIDYPPKIAHNRSTYDAIVDKTVTSTYPELIFYDPSITWGTIYVYPVPAAALTLHLNAWRQLQVFDTLTEALSLPRGYARMIKYNLAVELESIVGLPLAPKAHRIAQQSKTSIKRINNKPIHSGTETYYIVGRDRKVDIVAGV